MSTDNNVQPPNCIPTEPAENIAVERPLALEQTEDELVDQCVLAESAEFGSMTIAPPVEVLPTLKRVIWVTGGKGGVGKSTVARGLYDILSANRVHVKAFDSDHDNPQLHRYYKNVGHGINCIDLTKKGQADDLLAVMDTDQPDVILVDVAAGGGQALESLNTDQRILTDAADMGYKFTIVSVISRIKDSINLLKMTMDTTDTFEVDHIVFKNLYFGSADRFQLFDKSQTRDRLVKTGGLLLELPELFDDTYALLDESNLPFSTAAKADSGLARSHRARVIQWLNLFEAQAKIAGARIGL